MADSCVWAGFLAPGKGRTCSGQALASASSSKTKGRPRAAEVETTAEDIRFLGKFQGTPGLLPDIKTRRRYFSLFIRLLGFCWIGDGLSRAIEFNGNLQLASTLHSYRGLFPLTSCGSMVRLLIPNPWSPHGPNRTPDFPAHCGGRCRTPS